VLGPLLFIIYINDIYKSIDLCKAILFADDSTVSMKGKNKRVLFASMKNQLVKLVDWFHANKLSLNFNKTFCILFKPKTMVLNNVDDNLTLSIGDEIIEQVETIKFLGLKIDHDLEWSSHFSHLRSKLGRANYMLNSVKGIIPKNCMRTLYHALFYSHLVYGITVWGPSLKAGQINQLFKQQKKAVRIMTQSKYNAPTNNIFISLGLLKLTDIIDLELVKSMYLWYHNLSPEPILDLFQPVATQHKHNTRYRHDPPIPRRKYAILDKSFICKAPKFWSELTNEIRSAKTIKSFALKVKKAKIRTY